MPCPCKDCPDCDCLSWLVTEEGSKQMIAGEYRESGSEVEGPLALFKPMAANGWVSLISTMEIEEIEAGALEED